MNLQSKSPSAALRFSLLTIGPLCAQTTEALVAISLADSTQLRGTIIQEDENHIVVETASGLDRRPGPVAGTEA